MEIDPSAIENDNLTPEEEMRLELNKLRKEHRHIDNEINALMNTGTIDHLKIKRMKKVKLLLKDKIIALEIKLTPDIIA